MHCHRTSRLFCMFHDIFLQNYKQNGVSLKNLADLTLRRQVTTLGKLFTPMCLCGCKWSSDRTNFHIFAGLNLARVICKQPCVSC